VKSAPSTAAPPSRPDPGPRLIALPPEQDASGRDLAAGRPPVWSARLFWGFQAAFWFIAALSLFFLVVTYMPLEELSAIVTGRTGTGVVLTVLLHRFYTSAFFRRQERLASWLWVIVLTVVTSLASSAVWVALIRWAHFPEINTESPFVDITISRLFNLLIWHSMYFGIDVVLKTHALEVEASEAKVAIQAAELRQLHAQINPHFLFNSLNTIKANLADPAQAAEGLQNLSDYLHFALQESRPLEPLSRELDSLESYFRLQSLRFGPDLDCLIEASPAALKTSVPPMLIQPLLENAFKFGPKTGPLPLRIEIKASTDGEFLVLTVANTGCWVPYRTGGGGHGIGITNLRRRLQLLLDERASLRFTESDGLVTACVHLPLHPDRRPTPRPPSAKLAA
jgi:sensor histidine kinase YesM